MLLVHGPLTCPFSSPPQFLELLRSHQSRPAKCLTIMWALGQAGFTNLTEGLKGSKQKDGLVSPLRPMHDSETC